MIHLEASEPKKVKPEHNFWVCYTTVNDYPVRQMVGVSDREGFKLPGKVISVKKNVIRVLAFRCVTSRNRDISI